MASPPHGKEDFCLPEFPMNKLRPSADKERVTTHRHFMEWKVHHKMFLTHSQRPSRAELVRTGDC